MEIWSREFLGYRDRPKSVRWGRRGDDPEDIIHNTMNNSSLSFDFAACYTGRQAPCSSPG